MNAEKNIKRAFLWNMIGSTCYSLASVLYLMVVSRICGLETAGFFSLSYASAQLFLSIGRYGMRTFQATDLKEKYSFQEYAGSRVLTCFLMCLSGIIYALFSFHDIKLTWTCFFIVLLKMNDAVEDVYHGFFQQHHHVETMGKMLAFRNLFSIVCFITMLLATKDLFQTCAVVSILSLLICISGNEWAKRKILPEINVIPYRVSPGLILELMKTCTPLFLSTFLSLFLFNLPKYAMYGILSNSYQAYYSVLFMPSFVITLLCEFIFKPTITSVASCWWEKKYADYKKRILMMLSLIFAGGIVIILAGHLVGRYLLGILYHMDLNPYWFHFIVLLTGGVFGAQVYMIYNVLIAIRQEKCILPVYLSVSLIMVLPARWMVEQYHVMGACMNYFLSCTLLFLIFGSILLSVSRKVR